MAKFTNLPNELLLNIGSHLDKSSDKLHLLLLNHRLYIIEKPMLYENIHLQHSDYTEFNGCPVSRLTSTLKKRPSDLGSTTVSCHLTIDARRCCEDHGLIIPLPHLKFLKTLTIIALNFYGGTFCPAKLSGALQSVKRTLQSLTVCAGNSFSQLMGTSIGSLGDFTALKRLSIQSQILLGMRMYRLENPTPPSEMLPMGLEQFTLHCCDQTEFRGCDDFMDVIPQIVEHYSSPAGEKCGGIKWGATKCAGPCVFVPYQRDVPRPLKGVMACMMQDFLVMAKQEVPFLEAFTGTKIDPKVVGWDIETGERLEQPVE